MYNAGVAPSCEFSVRRNRIASWKSRVGMYVGMYIHGYLGLNCGVFQCSKVLPDETFRLMFYCHHPMQNWFLNKGIVKESFDFQCMFYLVFMPLKCFSNGFPNCYSLVWNFNPRWKFLTWLRTFVPRFLVRIRCRFRNNTDRSFLNSCPVVTF
jgi:hypothetical protein